MTATLGSACFRTDLSPHCSAGPFMHRGYVQFNQSSRLRVVSTASAALVAADSFSNRRSVL